MIIVRIVGGLGNQMFLYAYAKALEKKGYNVRLDISKYNSYKLHGGYQLDKFNIDIQKAHFFSILLSKFKFKKNIKEKSLLYNKSLKNLNGNEYVKGYFQNEKYFSEIRQILVKQFTIKKPLKESTKKYKNIILGEKKTCSLHIRRGDYISDSKANMIHGICDLSYYKRAVHLIEEDNNNTKFFVFSDDISWVKENLFLSNTVYIDHTATPHEDMYLMSLCKNNITANSSFSWWGAWLNQNENKTVIAPKKWFVSKENEVVCSNWIQL